MTAARHSRKPPRPRRRMFLFPVRQPATAISDAIEAGREDAPETVLLAPPALRPLPPDPLRERLAEVTPLPESPAGVAGVLERLRDGLLNMDGPPDASPALPAAYLRDVVPGQDATHEPLPGLPQFAGIDRTPDGSVAAGIWLGDGDGTGRFVLDGFGVDWFDALAYAADRAARALEAATEAVA